MRKIVFRLTEYETVGAEFACNTTAMTSGNGPLGDCMRVLPLLYMPMRAALGSERACDFAISFNTFSRQSVRLARAHLFAVDLSSPRRVRAPI